MAGKRGLLIVLEGLDRSGKSTQCKRMQSYVENTLGEKCVLFRFPDRTTPSGILIDQCLSQKCEPLPPQAMHLLFSANRWEQKSRMTKLLSQGVNIIVDRYAYSGIAFSVGAHSLDLQWSCQSDTGLLKPDLVLFLDLPLEVAASRGGFGDEMYERRDIQERVGTVYRTMCEKLNWTVVDASCTQDQVSEDLQGKVSQGIKELPRGEMGSLDFTRIF